jgi:hypothetical protein
MRSTRKVLSLAGILLAVIAVPSLWAYWIPAGTPVCTAVDEQTYQKMISDDAGGTIIAWRDSRNGSRDIYAQRVDVSGDVLWTVDGVALCLAAGSQYDLRLVSDGSGGAIVVWRDNRNGFDPEIYAQRVNASGNVQWTSDGVAVCSVGDAFNCPRIAPDGAGGAIVSWESNRFGDYDIFAQRVDASGAMQWTVDGIAVCSAKQNQMSKKIVSDGAGGAIMVWTDRRDGNDDIYAQRVNASGTVQWAVDGVALCTDPVDQWSIYIVSDGEGGAIVTWDDQRSGDYDIYAQRVDLKGDVLWVANGVPVCSLATDQRWPRIAMDGGGGAIIEWHDLRSGNYDIYAQRISAAGAALWDVGGVPVCTLPVSQYSMCITSDGAGGAHIAWNDWREDSYDIYAQRVDSSGAVQWAVDGIPVCVLAETQHWPEIVSDGAGGAIVAWRDLRDGNYDIYAQFISHEGEVSTYEPMISAVMDVPDDQGGKLEVYWNASCNDEHPETEITYYSVWRRLSAPLLATEEDASKGDASFYKTPDVPLDFEGAAVRLMDNGYSWEWLANIPARYFESYSYLAVSLNDSMGTDPGWQYFMVTAHTPLQYVFYDSPIDSGYSVDNLSPSIPGGFAAEQSYAPEGLNLDWDDNVEPDFHHYNLYRGLGADFVPSAENLVSSPGDAVWFDGEWTWDSGYWYKLGAVDVHGNMSGLTVAGPGNITGDDPMPVPDTTFLAQNYPNPFNPLTNIGFGINEQAYVSLRIYDAAGRLVTTLIDESRPAGRYEAMWNGSDGLGNMVSSGVYFYKLVAGDFVQTKKMVLLR